MKYLFFFLSLLCAFNNAIAQQNHVPNGDFEYYTQCPNSGSQTTRCTGWIDFSPTSDYYNCSFLATGWSGHSGTGYMGGVCLMPLSNLVFSERFGRPIVPLTPGVKYEVSMSVRLAYNSKFSSNNLGVFFYNTGYTSGIPTPQATFLSYGAIKDTGNWKRVVTSFTADSAYSNIVIGGFYNSTTFSMDTFTSGNIYAYYIFDSIVVKPVDSFYVMVTDSNLCALDPIQVSYVVDPDRNTNNVYTAQLSDKNGNFTNAVTIGTKAGNSSGSMTCTIPSNAANGTAYRIRVLSSSPADTANNISQAIKIANPDSSAINTSVNSPVCQGSTVQFAAGTNISSTTYAWTGPNGFNATSGNTTISGAGAANSGNYYVTIKFYGCEVKDTLPVTVKPLPVKPVANNNTPLCAGETVNITASSSTGGVSYSWTGPGSYTSTTQNPTLTNSTVAMSGDYIVTATLNGCDTKDTTTATVKPLPASITLSSNSPVCAGSTLLLNSTTSTTGSSYAWTGPNSFTSATQNSSISNATPAATGLYKITVSLNGCTYKDSILATVHPIPATPNITFNSPICIGETLTLNASTVTGATYSWTGANSFGSTSQNPTRSNMQFGDTGTYNVTATANGCTSPAATAKVSINARPFAVIFATPGDSICQGASVVFTALPNNAGGTPQYQWLVNAQPAGTGTVFNSSTLNNMDVVRCDMTESTKCSSPYTDQSNEIEMRVLPWLAPSVTITAIPNRPLEVDEYVTFTATTTNAGNNPKYQWKRNGANVQGATSNIWSANTLSDYDSISVEIISNYKCPLPIDARSNGIVVKVNSSVGNLPSVGGMLLYPNPNNGRFTLKGNTANNKNIEIEIINAVGQVVYKDIATPQSGILNKEIEMDGAVAGIYLLKLNSGNGTSVLRFLVR